MIEISYRGGAIDDFDLLERLPRSYQRLLHEINGFIQFGGGLHVRGICANLDWHSLQWAWTGADALHRHYRVLNANDIPFAEDCVGDQFLIRNEHVIRLFAETGEIENIGQTLDQFLDSAKADPRTFLGMHPLLQFQREGGELKPGQLLSVWPPFCTKESVDGVSLKAIPAVDRIRFLEDFSAQIGGAADGRQLRIKLE